MDEELHHETEVAETKPEGTPENLISYPALSPKTSSTEQPTKQNGWFWGWLSFPLLSGLTWLGDR